MAALSHGTHPTKSIQRMGGGARAGARYFGTGARSIVRSIPGLRRVAGPHLRPTMDRTSIARPDVGGNQGVRNIIDQPTPGLPSFDP